MSYVFSFNHHHERPPRELKHQLGGKGANLAEMTSVLGLPVPPGFTISTDACRGYLATGWPPGLDDQIATHVEQVEATMGKRLGDPHDPLLVSVRSGAASSMPGMMDTVLNLGLNDASTEALATLTGDDRFAYDSYRRFLSLYARIVLGLDAAPLDQLVHQAKADAGVKEESELDAAALRRLCQQYHELVVASTGSPFPQDPQVQLRGAVEAVFRSWNSARAQAYREREGIPHDLGTAVNVQAMVFGNRDDNSGTGVGFTRDASTGEQGAFGDFLVNAQGEDVVAGIRNTLPLAAMEERFPAVYRELMEIFARLEAHYRDMCDTEFTIEQGKLWMLQTRIGKRSARAALRMAVDMTRQDGWQITREEALLRISDDHLSQVLHPQFAEAPGQLLATGLPASPGAAVGRVCFSAAAAVEAASAGEDVILVRNETSPEDVPGMQVARGVLTARGGLVSHAAVVARGWGIPAVVGAETVHVAGDHLVAGGVTVRAGEVISLDGTTGEVVVGAMALSLAEPPEDFDTILGWADEVRDGRLAVRANADTAADAAVARRFGAQGIGLCRTEHMFLQADRLPIVRRMILATSPEEELAALEALGAVQQADFAEILAAMDGLPVTVRLLDPPLHEFLPPAEELLARRATHGLTDEEERLLAAAEVWREHNPMIGTRGVRLGVVRPGLYPMQVRALLSAAIDRVEAGSRALAVEIMIPLIVGPAELHAARGWVEQAATETLAGVDANVRSQLRVTIGTMIETPRAALTAGAVAEAADFFSFGTNDLTQMTFGFSRDDVETRLMPTYLAQGLLDANPFETIDRDGVGQLVRLAAEQGRAAHPGLKLGVCGEHGGDPASIAFFESVGVDYVSCSPYRVPTARLAGAQAILRGRPYATSQLG